MKPVHKHRNIISFIKTESAICLNAAVRMLLYGEYAYFLSNFCGLRGKLMLYVNPGKKSSEGDVHLPISACHIVLYRTLCGIRLSCLLITLWKLCKTLCSHGICYIYVN